MVSLLSLIFFMLLLLLTQARFGTLLKLNTLFNVMWLIGIVVINLGMGGIEPISNDLIIAIVVSVCIFNYVYFIFSVSTVHNTNFIETETLGYNLNRLYILNIVCYVYILPITVKAVGIISTLGFSTLRNYAFDTSLGLVTNLSSRICSWIIYPIFIVTMLISCFYIVNRKNDKIIYFALLDVAIYIVTFGGRSLIIRYLLYIAFTAILCSKSLSEAISKMSRKMKLACVVILVFCLYLISLRMWDGLSILDNIIIYVWGSVKYCDILITSSTLGGTLHGRGIFGLLYNPIAYFSNMILNTHFELSETLIQNVTDVFVSIGKSNFNALPSMMYIFWCDYNWVGIAVGTFVFVVVCIWAERRYERLPSLTNSVLLVFVIYSVFQSTSDYPIYKISHFFTIVAIFAITKWCCVKER